MLGSFAAVSGPGHKCWCGMTQSILGLFLIHTMFNVSRLLLNSVAQGCHGGGEKAHQLCPASGPEVTLVLDPAL
jgi:hypothetical protein